MSDKKTTPPTPPKPPVLRGPTTVIKPGSMPGKKGTMLRVQDSLDKKPHN